MLFYMLWYVRIYLLTVNEWYALILLLYNLQFLQRHYDITIVICLNPSIVTVYERSNYYKFLNRFFLIHKLAAIVIEYFFFTEYLYTNL